MTFFRRLLPIPLFALLVLSDIVALREVRHTLEWFIGDNALPASIAMLFLANAVTMAFFFDGLTHRSIRLLHGIAFLLYSVVAVAIYTAAAERSVSFLPASVAQDAFGLDHLTAARLGSLMLAIVLAGASFAFWGVMGNLINKSATAGKTVVWENAAAASGMPVDNILDLNRRTGT